VELLIFNSLNAKLNPICHLLALLGAHHILHVSRIRVKEAFPLTDVATVCHDVDGDDVSIIRNTSFVSISV
jgi:hypothetical protein